MGNVSLKRYFEDGTLPYYDRKYDSLCCLLWVVC